MTNDGASSPAPAGLRAPSPPTRPDVDAQDDPSAKRGIMVTTNGRSSPASRTAELSKIPRKLLFHRKSPNGSNRRADDRTASNNFNNKAVKLAGTPGGPVRTGPGRGRGGDEVTRADTPPPNGDKACDAFSRAFLSRNGKIGEALKSLESLNARIGSDLPCLDAVPEALHQVLGPGQDDARREREAVLTSMALMRRLLVDAQAKFRRMVEENRQLGERIDGDVQNAHENVAALRAELSNTAQRLEQLQCRPAASAMAASTATAPAPLGPPATVVPPPPPTGGQPAPLSAAGVSTSSSSSSPSFSSSVANSTTSKSSNNAESPVNKPSSTSPDGQGTPRRTAPKVIPRRPNSGGDVPNSGAGSPREAGSKAPEVQPRSGGRLEGNNAATDSESSSPELPDKEKHAASSVLSDRIGKKLSAVGAEADKWASRTRARGPAASPGSLDKLIVRPTSPAQPDNCSASVCSPGAGAVGPGGDSANVSTRLRLENERLKREVSELRKLVSASGVSPGSSASSAAGTSPGAVGGEGATSGGEGSSAPGFSVIADCDGNLRKVRTLESELQQTKDALNALKADRKRLKAEKFDLLNQMKQLYGTLEDKEKELRDFIRNYEQRMRESEASLQQLSTEREERERERWSLLRHARDEAERSLTLAAQLQHKEQQLQQLQEQLGEARRSGCLSDQESVASLSVSRLNGTSSGTLVSRGDRDSRVLGDRERDRGSCSADSGVRGSSDRESGATSAAGNLSDSTTDGERKRTGTPTITVEGSMDMDSISVVSSVTAPHMYQHSVSTPKDCSPSLSPLNAHSFSRSIDNSVLSRSVEQLSSPIDMEPRRSKRAVGLGRGGTGTWGSISRVFARGRHRKVVSPTSQDESCCESVRSWSPLTEEGYAEKLRLLREAAAVPMERWRASTVLAWLEIALGMPQYGPRCAENVKSGKVLLELSDMELECGLGVTHPMHRKKLRLAIEEHRHPALVRYPCIAQLTHTWVSSEWLPDLGLAQYSENFAANMVDARMLDHLSKKELEKFVGVTRKFHQASIVHGIHLLRMVKYDRQALAVRRHQSDHVDADPLVWTNQRFMRWARSIDLAEYADNLKDSGVHGALVVLEPSFNGDTMATALGIPPSKNIIRRHLAAELEALVLPARAAFEHYLRVTAAERRRAERLIGGGSLGRSFSRSYAGSLAGVSAALPQGQGVPGVRSPGGTLPRDAERLSGLGGLSGGGGSPAENSLFRPGTTSPGGPHTDQDTMDVKDRRRASLRTYSLLYLKKFSTWRSSQGSLSRALGLGSGKSSQRSDSLPSGHHAHGGMVHVVHPTQQHALRTTNHYGYYPAREAPRDIARDVHRRSRELRELRESSLREAKERSDFRNSASLASASASASSSSENGSSSASSFACRSASPGPSHLSSPSASVSHASGPHRMSTECNRQDGDQRSISEAVAERSRVGAVKKRHRRVKSIGDIDSVTVTPV